MRRRRYSLANVKINIRNCHAGSLTMSACPRSKHRTYLSYFSWLFGGQEGVGRRDLRGINVPTVGISNRYLKYLTCT